MSAIKTETAKVYRANGRRWFTKWAAYKAAAKEKINSRCECENDDRWGSGSLDYTPGFTCWYHKDSERYAKMLHRLAKIYQIRDAAARKGRG